jgi:ribonuclease BN (tRNA processing enzyme)
VRRLDILLTHFHMDHLQGLGFFAPLFNPRMEVHIWGPPSTTMPLRERLARYLSPPLFPVCLRDFSCRLVLHDAPRGKVELGGLTVRSDLICHPGPTMGYRVEDGNAAVAYLPDHELPLGTPQSKEPGWISGHALAHGVDLLMHDSQYTQEEYDERNGWGHSTPRQAVEFARVAGVKKMVTFHHDPNHDDAMLDRMRDEACRGADGTLAVVPGTEGATFEL